MSHFDPIAHFQHELEVGRQAEAYLMVGGSAPHLREVGEACAKAFLGARNALEDHPDYVVFDPEVLGINGLKVEHITHRKDGVRCVSEELRFRPLAGSRRAILLLDAHQINPDAQAALLKTVEEPPPGTLLILTATQLSKISLALRSRCRTWRIPSPSAEVLERQAAGAGLSETDWASLTQALGFGEKVLALSRADRAFLIQQHSGIAAWLAAPQCPCPDFTVGEGNLGEKRARAELLLSATIGWATATYGLLQLPPAELDRRLGHLQDAIADIRAQVTPDMVVEDLVLQLKQA
jgi:hypothetical protein